MIIYTRQNGYGDIDVNAEPFQLGRRLYEAHVMFAKIKKEEDLSKEEIQKLLHYYCELVSWTGQLRADYSVMKECAEGKAVYLTDEDSWTVPLEKDIAELRSTLLRIKR